MDTEGSISDLPSLFVAESSDSTSANFKRKGEKNIISFIWSRGHVVFLAKISAYRFQRPLLKKIHIKLLRHLQNIDLLLKYVTFLIYSLLCKRNDFSGETNYLRRSTDVLKYHLLRTIHFVWKALWVGET
jgi:hypothetical protein